MIPKSKDATLHERITLLQDVNRPLEEHWSVRSKFGLDAKTSDYIYKHHIARLEDIYTHRRFEIKNPVRVLTMSPTAQLYGIHGLKSSMYGGAKQQKKREQSWVQNHQKYHTLRDQELPTSSTAATGQGNNTSSRRTLTASHSAPAFHSSQTSLKNNNHHTNMDDSVGIAAADTHFQTSLEDTPEETYHIRRVAIDDTAPRCDLIAFGLYRLTPTQQSTYQAFVNMLSQFDTEDMRRIAEDAVGEAYSDHVLAEYSGIDAPANNAPVFAS